MQVRHESADRQRILLHATQEDATRLLELVVRRCNEVDPATHPDVHQVYQRMARALDHVSHPVRANALPLNAEDVESVLLIGDDPWDALDRTAQ